LPVAITRTFASRALRATLDGSPARCQRVSTEQTEQRIRRWRALGSALHLDESPGSAITTFASTSAASSS
jgi:hypothetical protein